jgi:hypothetical protein
MSIYYYATFAPVPLPPEEVAQRLAALLDELGSRMAPDVDELVWERGRFVYTMEERESGSLQEALKSLGEGRGVEVHFDWLRRSCSFLVWRDLPGHLTVTFCEPGSLFEQQQGESRSRQELAALLLELLRRLEADFCILEAESVFRSRIQGELMQWLDELPQSGGRDWAMVLARSDAVPIDRLPKALRKSGSFRYWAAHHLWGLSLLGDMGLIYPGLPKAPPK